MQFQADLCKAVSIVRECQIIMLSDIFSFSASRNQTPILTVQLDIILMVLYAIPWYEIILLINTV